MITYFIDTPKGIVVAKFEHEVFDSDYEVWSWQLREDITKWYWKKKPKADAAWRAFHSIVKDRVEKVLSEIGKLSGKAKCNFDADVFDEELGKALARKRLLYKYMDAKYRILNDVYCKLNDMEDCLSLQMAKTIWKISHTEKEVGIGGRAR